MIFSFFNNFLQKVNISIKFYYLKFRKEIPDRNSLSGLNQPNVRFNPDEFGPGISFINFNFSQFVKIFTFCNEMFKNGKASFHIKK